MRAGRERDVPVQLERADADELGVSAPRRLKSPLWA